MAVPVTQSPAIGRFPLPQIHDAPSQLLPDRVVLLYMSVMTGGPALLRVLVGLLGFPYILSFFS